MEYIINTDSFAQLAEQITKKINDFVGFALYISDDIELNCSAKDFNDGKGRRFYWLAGVKNPYNNYNLYYDIAVVSFESPEKALNDLLLSVDKLLEKINQNKEADNISLSQIQDLFSPAKKQPNNKLN